MRIPQYQIQVEPKAAPNVFQSVPNATPSAFGADQAVGLGRLAREVQRGGDVLAAHAVRYQEVENETRVNDVYSSAFSPAVRAETNKFRELQGKAAVDALPAFAKRIEEIRTESRKDMNPAQARMFDQISRRHVDLELDRMSGYAVQQRNAWREQTHASTLKNYLDEASDKASDPAHVNRMIRSGRAEIEAYAAEAGHDPETVKQRIRSFTSAAREQVVERMLNTSPGAAHAYYKQHETDFDAAAKTKLERNIRARQEHLGALAKAKLRDGLDEETAALSLGLTPNIAKAQQNEQQARALGDERTAARWNLIATKGAALAEFGALPLADQGAALRKKYDEIADPARRTEGSIAEYQIMSTVLQRSQALYKNDEWLAALRTGVSRETPGPVTTFQTQDSFDRIAARLPAADAVSERERAVIVPLYREEKLKFAAQWAAAVPSQKAALAAGMDKALGKYAPAFWQEMAAKGKDGLALASVAVVAREDIGLARVILDGRAARVNDPKYAPTADEQSAEYGARFGPAFKNIGTAGETMFQEVIDIAAKLAADDGNKQPGTTYLDRAMEMRFGVRRLPNWRGVQTVPPERGADIGLWLRTMTVPDMGSLPIMPSTQRRIAPDVIANRAKIFSVGEGRYTVEIDGETLAGDDGRPYVLNYWLWKQNRRGMER